jgi:putative ABC transport system ATP-binding protein
MTSVIELTNVVKTYTMGDTTFNALDGVTVAIQKGDFAAIIGPSGSGKSTLMHIIGILDRPTSGKVILDAHDVSTLTEKEAAIERNKNLGFVFQSFNLLPRTSAVDNVALPLIYAGVDKNERTRRAQEALVRVGLEGKFNNTPAQLSGGQQQRVAIARALINNPSLILADEPTGNLDSKSGREIMDFFRELNSHGNTIVLVTHSPEVAHEAKRVIEIKDGKIEKDTVNKIRSTKH